MSLAVGFGGSGTTVNLSIFFERSSIREDSLSILLRIMILSSCSISGGGGINISSVPSSESDPVVFIVVILYFLRGGWLSEVDKFGKGTSPNHD